MYHFVRHLSALLTTFSSASNELDGPLPNEITALSTLKILRLYDNKLVGDLPKDIGNLPLEILDIEDNELTGKVFTPSFFKLTGTLTELLVNGNNFTGNLPDNISDFTLLKALTVGNNGFSGRIPNSITEIEGLVDLVLKDCKFDGPIPDDWNDLQNLKVLLMDGNELNGTIPESISNLKNLKQLTLSENKLTGPIPKDFEKLKNLRNFRASENSLTGPIPKVKEMKDLSKSPLRRYCLIFEPTSY